MKIILPRFLLPYFLPPCLLVSSGRREGGFVFRGPTALPTHAHLLHSNSTLLPFTLALLAGFRCRRRPVTDWKLVFESYPESAGKDERSPLLPASPCAPLPPHLAHGGISHRRQDERRGRALVLPVYTRTEQTLTHICASSRHMGLPSLFLLAAWKESNKTPPGGFSLVGSRARPESVCFASISLGGSIWLSNCISALALYLSLCVYVCVLFTVF